MTTASTSSVLAQTSNATYQAWVQEVYTNLVTNCGLVQTNDTGQAAVPFAGTVPVSTGVANATGYYLFTFNDPLAPGTLSTTALNSGGSGYDGGGTHTYTGITATGATSGATCTCTVTVTSGVCGNMGTIAAAGNFIVGEKITIPNSSLGGSGSGASWTATALSSGAPVIFRLDFGANSAGTTAPMIWITLGAGTNGAGTIAGTAGTSRMTQVTVLTNSAQVSTSTPYTSRYVYNSTYGYCGMVFKIGAAAANLAFGGMIIFRTSDSGGNPTGNAVCLISNSSTTTGLGNAACGIMQCMTYSSGAGSTIYPTLNSTMSGFWTSIGSTTSFVFGLTATLENSIAFITPIYTMDPGLKFSAFNGVGLIGDFPLGNTASYAMVGSTPLTFISCGIPFGNPSGNGFAQNADANLAFCMLWQ